MDVITLYLCGILLVGSESPDQLTLKGKGLHKGINTLK